MTTYYDRDGVTVHHGDCLDVLAELPDASVDAVATDPPYELAFMGRTWDATGIAYNVDLWRHCLRILKPGGHLLAFGGTRTWHRLAVAVEDAGFEIRDSIAWMYGSGFPKSLDVSKAIDKDNGRRFEDRFALGRHIRERRESLGLTRADVNAMLGAATKAEHYESTNRGFARVPTLSDWIVLQARLGLSEDHRALIERVEAEREVTGSGVSGKTANMGGLRGVETSTGQYDITAPATDAAREWQGWGTALKPAFEPIVVARKPLAGTVAANVLAHGTGALNVDGCRVGWSDGDRRRDLEPAASTPFDSRSDFGGGVVSGNNGGRWPANVILDESQSRALDEQSGESVSVSRVGSRTGKADATSYGVFTGQESVSMGHTDSGGASRFMYTAKADAAERPKVNGTAHPTVKPLSLMRWLVRLVTPPGGTVLEPFAGSGTTVEACILEHFNVVAIEREADYLPLIEARIARRRDPARAVELSGEDMGLLGLLGEEPA